MISLKTFLTEALSSAAALIISKLKDAKHNCLWNDQELMEVYNMKRLDISVSTGNPDCLRVVATPVSKRSSRLAGYNNFIKDITAVGEEMNLIVCIEEQKMPKAQADICKRWGFTYQHGRKIRYELPTLTEFYYIPKKQS